MTNQNRNSFEFFDVTADIGFRAYGVDINEVFENAAMAMFEVMTETSKVNPLAKREISMESEDEEGMLYDWLSELLFLHDYEGLVFSKFRVNISQESPDKFNLQAEVWGDTFNPSLHEIRDEVKAVTFHLMEIKKEDGCKVQVILDI